MRTIAIMLLLALLPASRFEAAAQPWSIGAYQSYKGVGVTVLKDRQGDFRSLTLVADMPAVFAGRSSVPGVKLEYSSNFRIVDLPSSDTQRMFLYAGSGVSAGWLQDYKNPRFGFEAALTGNFGIRTDFARGVVLTFGISLEAGAFIHREEDGTKVSIYRNGFRGGLYPYLTIAYKFK